MVAAAAVALQVTARTTITATVRVSVRIERSPLPHRPKPARVRSEGETLNARRGGPTPACAARLSPNEAAVKALTNGPGRASPSDHRFQGRPWSRAARLAWPRRGRERGGPAKFRGAPTPVGYRANAPPASKPSPPPSLAAGSATREWRRCEHWAIDAAMEERPARATPSSVGGMESAHPDSSTCRSGSAASPRD